MVHLIIQTLMSMTLYVEFCSMMETFRSANTKKKKKARTIQRSIPTRDIRRVSAARRRHESHRCSGDLC